MVDAPGPGSPGPGASGDDPVPAVTDLNRPFWDAVRRHRLVAPVCAACGHRWLPPGPLCPSCWSLEVEWAELGHRGIVTSTVRFHRHAVRGPALAEPYVVAAVTLAEGPRLYARPAAGVELAAGDDVEVCFVDLSAQRTVLRLCRPPSA